MLVEEAPRITGHQLAESQGEQLAKYLRLLIEWNSVHRLVGSSDPFFIVERLILDSLLFLRVLPSRSGRIVDVGSGAGLPGIPLKIVEPAFELTMLEARRRRASFLATAIRVLPLANTALVHARAEEAASEYGGRFDMAVMRSVGRVDRLGPMVEKLVNPGGVVVVSGPPSPGETAFGFWVRVAGVKSGEYRNFLVHRRPVV